MTTKPDDGALLEQIYSIVNATKDKHLHTLREACEVTDEFDKRILDLIAAREEAAVRAFADGIRTSLNDDLVSSELEEEPESVRRMALAAVKTFTAIINGYLDDLHPEPTNEKS